MRKKVTWQSIIKEFKGERHQGDGFAATMVLFYLVFGEDSPYHMAKIFATCLKEGNGWNKEMLKNFKMLDDHTQLNTLMSKMENRGLLFSKKERKGRRRRFYRINPDIIIYPETTDEELSARKIVREFIGRADDDANDYENFTKFLNQLSTKDRKDYFETWRHIEVFDFINFLKFLESEALKLKKDRISNLLHDHELLLRHTEDPSLFLK